jgi:riboflavin biosynthesis pyrimidine reductase
MSVAARSRIAIEPLLGAAALAPGGLLRGGELPTELRVSYGGDLAIPLRSDRPTVISNFVTTLDGVVSYNTPEQAGGGEISGFSDADHFVMGLLRAMSDVVLIGAGTLRAAHGEAWSHRFTHPESADALSAYRASLGLAPEATTAVVSRTGAIDLAHPGLSNSHVPVLVITTEAGATALRAQGPARHVEVVAAGRESVEPRSIVAALHDRGTQVVLCEGGPHLFGQMLRDRLIDDLFVTLSPQVAGRASDTPRLSLVEGTAFAVADAPWSRLVDLRRSDNHLFARYRFEEIQS